MWPLLALSVVSLCISVERLFFWLGYRNTRIRVEEKLLHAAEEPDTARRIKVLESTVKTAVKDAVRGLKLLDTVITVAPLLGILGTVTGIISAFSILNLASGETPKQVSAGIAEALITTAFGLMIAIFTVLPYNYFSHLAVQEAEALSELGTHLEAGAEAVSRVRTSEDKGETSKPTEPSA